MFEYIVFGLTICCIIFVIAGLECQDSRFAKAQRGATYVTHAPDNKLPSFPANPEDGDIYLYKGSTYTYMGYCKPKGNTYTYVGTCTNLWILTKTNGEK